MYTVVVETLKPQALFFHALGLVGFRGWGHGDGGSSSHTCSCPAHTLVFRGSGDTKTTIRDGGDNVASVWYACFCTQRWQSCKTFYLDPYVHLHPEVGGTLKSKIIFLHGVGWWVVGSRGWGLAVVGYNLSWGVGCGGVSIGGFGGGTNGSFFLY